MKKNYIKASYIKTMDFIFEDVIILDVKDEWQLMNKIKNNEVIRIINEDILEYINSNYIMYYKLKNEGNDNE